VGSGVAAGVGSADGSADGSTDGAVDGSVDGAGLSVGPGVGSAAIVPAGATIAKSRSATCRAIKTRRRRKKRRDAAESRNIDMAPLPRLADPSSNLARARVVATATG
jgi:hypothetical protein